MPRPPARWLVSLALLGLLAGCRANAHAAPKLELWTMQLKPTFEPYMTGVLKAWEARHPGIAVDWVDLPASEIESKTLTAAASGHPPDVINLNPSFANRLATVKALVPIPLTPALRDRYFASAWQANTVDGQVVGIPWYLSTSLTFYNTALWRQAGLPAGRYPRTYDALFAAAKQIKARTHALGFMPNFGDRGHFMEVLVQQGVPLLAPDGHHAGFFTPAGIQVMTQWVQMIQQGVVPTECLTQGHREAVDRFQAGQDASLTTGPQFLKIIQQNSPQLYSQIGIGPAPTGASGKVGVSVMNLVVLKSSPRIPLALDLAEFITNGENQLAFCKLVSILPSVKSAAADPYFTAGAHGDLAGQARALAAAQLPRAVLLVPPLPHQSDLAKSLDDALARAALGQASPAQALEQAAKEWDHVLAG